MVVVEWGGGEGRGCVSNRSGKNKRILEREMMKVTKVVRLFAEVEVARPQV